ncbi:hypothetical protein X801_03681 [Opisthorchis viverrini]|uniref:Uncharacterized protein n=1 Tax=Opisthorchis viverrini TaxID=6198 RepID=A0A1S8X145_OPIVI|nr:hypothetical protein X801_03681 [Opisthorchis viverrini]
MKRHRRPPRQCRHCHENYHKTSFPRPPQKRPPEKQDKFIAPPKPLQLPSKTSNKPTELSSKAPKIAPQPPPSAAPFKAKPAPPRKQPPPSTAVKEPAEKQPPQPPITSAPASTTKAKPKKPPVKKSKRMELSRQHAPTESVLQESPQVAEEMEGQSIVDTTTATIPVLSEDLHAHATGSLTDGLAEQHIRRSPSEDHSDHGESLSMGQQEPTMLAVGEEWPENEHLELVNQTLKAEQEETVQIQTIQEATSPEAGIHTEFTGLEEVSAYKPGREELSPLIEEQTDTISGVLTGLKAGPEVESAKPKTIPSENRLAESSNAPLDGTLETKQTVVDDGTVLSGEQSILEEPLRVSTEASVIGGVSVLTAETDEGSKQAAAQKLILQSDAVTDKVSEGERLRKQVNDEKIVDVELVRSEPEEQFISERSETVKSKATSGPHLQASEEDLGEMQQKPQQVHTGDALQYQVRDSQPLEITQPTESVGHVSGPSISKTTLKDKSGAPLESPPDAREPPGKTTETNKVSEQPLEDHIPDAVSEKAMISLSPKVSSFKTALEDKAYKKQELRGEERRVSGISVETLPTQKSEDIPGIIPTERKRDERSEVTRTLEEPFVASFSPTPHLLQERKHDEQPSITRKASLDNVLEPQNPSEDVELRKSAEDKIMDGSMLPVTLPKQPTDQHDEQVRTEATDVPEELGAPSTISIESDHSTRASAQERKVDLSKPVTSGISVGEPAAIEQVAEDGRWMKQTIDDGIDETVPLGTSKATPIEDQREIVVGRGESPQDQSTMASIQERETDLVKPVSSEIPVGEPAAVEQVAEDGRWMKQMMDDGIDETAPLGTSKAAPIEDQREIVVGRGESPQDQSTMASIQERETDLVKPVSSEIPVGEPAAVAQVAEDGRWMKQTMDENISETGSLEALKSEKIDGQRDSENQLAYVKSELIPLPTTLTPSVKELEVSREPLPEKRISDTVIREAEITNVESRSGGAQPMNYDRPETFMVRSDLVGPPLYRTQELSEGEPKHILIDEELLLDSSSPLPSATAAMGRDVEKTETYIPLKDNLGEPSSGEGLHLSEKKQIHGARGIMKVHPHLKLAGPGSDHQLAERKQYESSRIQATSEPIVVTRTEVETEMTIETACKNDRLMTNVRVRVSSPDLLTRDGGASPLSSPSFGATSETEGCEDGEPFGTLTLSVDIQVDVKLGNDGKHYIELQQHGPEEKPFDEDNHGEATEGNVFDTASVRGSSSAGKAQNLQAQTGIVLKTPLKKTSGSRPQSASCIRSSFRTEFSFNQPEGPAIHSARISPLTSVPDYESSPPPIKTRSPDYELDRTVFDKGTTTSHYRVSPKTGEHCATITPTQHISGNELKPTRGPQARGRRGQSARVSARAALLDSGQNYGFVSKISVEIGPLVEDSLIQPDTLKSQPAKENVVNLIALPGSTSEMAPAVSTKVDPIKKPEEPKLVSLKYFTSVDNEPLVTNEMDVIRKKTVQVLTDASVVEEENTNPNTQTADSLVTPREVVVSNEYELELEPTYSEHTSPGPFCSNKYELDTISPIHPDAISSVKAFEAKEYTPIGLSPEAENDESLHVELVRRALAKASMEVQRSVDSEFKDENDHRQSYITSGSDPQAFTDQLVDPSETHGRQVPRTNAADSTLNSLLTSSVIEIVFKTGREGQIELDTVSGINIRTSIEKSHQSLPRQDGYPSGRHRPVSPSSPETTENVRSQQSVTEQRILSPMDKRNSHEIHMQLSTSLDAYAPGPLCKPDKCPQELAMLKSSEIKLSACRCALNKCTCFEHGQSTTPGQGTKIMKLSSVTSQPDKGCILNLAVSVIHADEGELELTTQISTSKKVRSEDGHRDSRNTSPNVRGLGEAHTARNSPQTPTGLANLDDSTVAPKSITFNVSTTTKIDIPKQNMVNCDLFHSNEQHLVISNPDNSELPVPPQRQSNMSPQPLQKHNVTGVKFVQEITQELNANELFHSACPITLENETTIFENSNNSERRKSRTNQLYLPLNQPICPSKSSDEFDGVNHNLVNSTVLRLCNRELGGKVLKTEFETDLGVAGHKKSLDTLVYDVQTKLKSKPCTSCRPEEFSFGNDNCRCWSNNNTELLDSGIWQCFGQRAYADDAASAFQMLNVRQNMHSGHTTNVREYSITSDEQKAVGYLQEHAFFCPSVRFSTALSAWEQSASGVGCRFGRLVEEHSLPVGYGFTEADVASNTPHRSVSQRWEDSRPVCLLVQDELISETESTLRQWNQPCRDSPYSTRTSITKGSHVQGGFYLTNTGITKTHSPLFIAVQKSVIPGVAIQVREWLGTSVTLFPTTNEHPWPEFRIPLETSCPNSGRCRMTSTNSEYGITLLLNSIEQWLLLEDSEVEVSPADMFFLHKHRHSVTFLRTQSQNDKSLRSNPSAQVSEKSQDIEVPAEPIQEKSGASKKSSCHGPRMCSSTALDDGNERMPFYKNLAWNYHQIASTGHLRDSLSECSSDMFQETQLNFKLRYSEPDSEKHWKRHQACKMEAFNFVSILKPSTCLLLEVLCYSVLEETNCESVENLIPLLGSIEPVPTDTQESIDSSASFATSIPQEKDLSRSNSSVDSVLSSSTLPICLRQPTYNTDEHSSYLSSYGCGNSVSGSKTNNELYAPFDDETSSHSTDSYGEKKRSFVSRTDPDMRAHSLDRHMVPAFNYVAEVRKLKSTIHLCDMCLETNCPKSCDPTVTLSSLLTVPTTGRQSRPESQRNGMDFPPKGANSHLIHDYSSQIEPTTKPKQFKIHGNKETLWSSLAVKLCNTTAVPIIVTQSYSFNTVDRSSTCDSLQHSGHKSSEYDETVHKLTEPDEPMQSNPLTIDRYSTHKHDSLPVMALLEITEHCAMSDGMTEVGSREMDKVCLLVSTESRVCMDSNPNTSSSTAGNHPCMSTTPFRCLLSLCYVDLLSAESIRLLEPEGVVVKPQFVEQWTFQVAFELLAAYFDTFFQYPHCALSDYCFKTCLKIRPNFRGPESVDIVSDRNVRKLSNAADCRINAVQSTSKTLAKLASKTSVLPTDQLTCPDFLPSSAQTTRQSLPNDHKTATTTLYKHGDLMGYNYNRTQVHLTRGVEQCTFKAAYPSTADYSRSQPTRLLKLIKTALEAPLRPACALNHYTVQTVQPLLKVYAFSELIGNSFPLCHTGTTQKQSWCTILKSGLNVDSQDSRCLPLKGVAIPHLPTVRRLSLPLTIINSMELVFSVPLTVKPFKKLKAHRSIPRTSIALTCLIKTAYLTKKVSLENTSYDRARTMTDTSHQTMDLTTASELSNGHQRPCSVPESFSTLTRSDISKTFQTSIPEAEGLEGFSENSYTGEVSINSNRLSNVLPSSDRNNKRTPLAKGKVKQHAPTSVTSVVSKVEKPNSYGKSMENLVKGDRRRQWSIPPVKQMVKTIYAGGKQMLKPGKTGKQTRKADPFTGSLLPVAGDVGADTVKSSPVSHHSSGNSKSFMHRAGRHMSRKQRSSSSSSTASRLFQTLNDADSRKTEPPGTSPYTKSRIPIPVQHPISMMNGCWNRLSLFQTARNQTNAPVLVHGSDSTCEHRIQCDRKISSILYSSATSSCSHTPASALSSYAIKRKCFTNLGKTQKRETAKALNTSDTRSRSALKQVSLNRFPSVSSRIPKLIGDDPNSAGNKHSVFARIRTGISADHHKVCDINHICMATPLKKTAGRSMVTPKREKKFKTSRNN